MSEKEQHNDAVDTVVDEAVAEETLETAADGQPEEAPADAADDARYAELAKQAEDAQQRYLRAQADFDNFRRRTMKEKEELGQYASMKLLGQLLPVVDNFERAIAASSSNSDYESLAKGVDMIFRQLTQTLEAEGLKPIQAVGEPFNPEFHQAIMQVESDEYEEGIVVEEVQKGYMLKDKVLRPAMVKVSG
ncbi:nucleotide exchange factor GrpE [Paenibacillus nanensis]|uniref:Protein GrpE n=1 Tax=Paenibacillus nanensis TaxID=393251 RepID=A0A3A1V083_9BACL|nr:nucleotide exchange factor GrpE [Paenibacillus nanensis]RIX54107.1 nucleotide exchange factor GrpE [Paenibacillus nanensis]